MERADYSVQPGAGRGPVFRLLSCVGKLTVCMAFGCCACLAQNIAVESRNPPVRFNAGFSIFSPNPDPPSFISIVFPDGSSPAYILTSDTTTVSGSSCADGTPTQAFSRLRQFSSASCTMLIIDSFGMPQCNSSVPQYFIEEAQICTVSVAGIYKAAVGFVPDCGASCVLRVADSSGVLSLQLGDGPLAATITVDNPQTPLVIDTGSLPAGIAGQAYPSAGQSAQLSASGGTPPYTWGIVQVGNPAVSPLEASNLVLDPVAGTLSSTSILGGVNSFTVVVTDSVGTTANKLLSVTVPCGFTIGDVRFSHLQNGFAQWQGSSDPNDPVPDLFGFEPNPNPIGYQKCSTLRSGCALTMAAGVLATIDGGDNIAANTTPRFVDSEFILPPVGYGTGSFCPPGGSSCTPPVPDWCEFTGSTWGFHLPLIDQFDVSLVEAPLLPATFSGVDELLEQSVCEHHQSVILRLRHANSSRTHFVLATGRLIDPSSGEPDWQLFDGGQNPVHTSDTLSNANTLGQTPSANLYSLRGHLLASDGTGGFYFQRSADVPRLIAYTLNGSEARVYESSGTPFALLVSAGSPVELLVTDPQARQLGNRGNGPDILSIPGGSYYRDGFLEDDDEGGPVSNETTEKKNIYITNAVSGNYSLNVIGTGLGIYTLEYDALAADHTVQSVSASGVANIDSNTVFSLQYSSTPNAQIALARLASFAGVLGDINNFLQLGLIDNQGIGDALSAKIGAASDATTTGDSATAKNVLNAFMNQVNAQTGKHITGVAPAVLLDDANSLISQLP